MVIQVLGSGCTKCNDLYDNARIAVDALPQGGHTVAKVDDVDVFVRLGVMVTPALVLDDEVVSTGRVLSVEEIGRLIADRL